MIKTWRNNLLFNMLFFWDGKVLFPPVGQKSALFPSCNNYWPIIPLFEGGKVTLPSVPPYLADLHWETKSPTCSRLLPGSHWATIKIPGIHKGNDIAENETQIFFDILMFCCSSYSKWWKRLILEQKAKKIISLCLDQVFKTYHWS